MRNNNKQSLNYTTTYIPTHIKDSLTRNNIEKGVNNRFFSPISVVFFETLRLTYKRQTVATNLNTHARKRI